jgi:hypothetical protein
MQEIQRIKDVITRLAQKEAAELKKLEDAEQKTRDTAADL